MLASNPLRNNRSETHRKMRGRPASRPFSSIITIDFPMPQKTQHLCLTDNEWR